MVSIRSLRKALVETAPKLRTKPGRAAGDGSAGGACGGQCIECSGMSRPQEAIELWSPRFGEDTNVTKMCDFSHLGNGWTWSNCGYFRCMNPIFTYYPIRNGHFPVCKLWNNQWVPCWDDPALRPWYGHCPGRSHWGWSYQSCCGVLWLHGLVWK